MKEATTTTATTYTQHDLEREIRKLIQDGIDSRQALPETFIIQAIVERHPEIYGADRDYYILSAYGHTRYTVRQILREIHNAEDDDDSGQFLLPGHSHIKKAYLVERDGEQVVVPVEDATAEELTEKIRHLRKMAESCINHAEELERYRLDKFGW